MFNPQTLPSLAIVFLTNLTLAGQDIITFFAIDRTDGSLQFSGLHSDITLQEFLFIPIAWTVAVEFSFYLVAPFIVSLNIYRLVLILASTLLLRILLYFVGVDGSFFIFRFAPTELFWFVLGLIAYYSYKKKLFIPVNYAIPLLLLLAALMLNYNKIGEAWTDVLLYILAFLSLPALFVRFNKSTVDKYFGDLCYPIYISHCLFLLVVDANRFPKPYGKGLPLLVLTLLFSFAVNKFFLLPLEKYRTRRVKQLKNALNDNQ